MPEEDCGEKLDRVVFIPKEFDAVMQ